MERRGKMKTEDRTCPVCKGTQHTQETDTRFQCNRCRWRFVLKPDGSTEDWLKGWTGGRRRAAQRYGRRR